MSFEVVITMAGRGSRFAERGYDIPKYEVLVRGRTLFSWSLHSLQQMLSPASNLTFVCLDENKSIPFIESQLAVFDIGNLNFVELPKLTDGQATSAIAAKEGVADRSQKLLIYNIDTYVDPAYLCAPSVFEDGWIPCFKGQGDAWSFVRVDANFKAADVKEKQRISDLATIGLYGFQSFQTYEETYHACFKDKQNLVHGEKYIAPMYNHLIRCGKSINITEVPTASVHPLGTPEDVIQFQKGE